MVDLDVSNCHCRLVLCGGGKTIFPGDGEARIFELTSTTTASTGVQVCHYQRTR